MLYSYIIYKFLFPNNKIYIGQTSQDFNIRLSIYKFEAYNKKSKDYNRLINKTIRKYGWENVKKEIICTVSEEFVDEAERYFIEKFNSLVINGCGYNIEDGGNRHKHLSEETKKKLKKAHLGKKPSDKTREIWSNQRKGENNSMWGKTHTKETIKLMKQNHANFSGKNHPFYGRKHSEESKENNRQAHLGIPNLKNRKSIIAINKNTNQKIKFEYVIQASQKLNINRNNISSVLTGKRKFAGEYTFKYLI